MERTGTECSRSRCEVYMVCSLAPLGNQVVAFFYAARTERNAAGTGATVAGFQRAVGRGIGARFDYVPALRAAVVAEHRSR